MFRLVIMAILIAGLIMAGCSKKDEDIAALEEEAAQDETAAVLDSLQGEVPVTDSTSQAIGQEMEAEPTEPAEPEISQADYSGLEGYVVQIGSYASYEFAEMMAEKYRGRDFPAFVVTANIGGITYYRLRVGVYETIEEAKQIGEMLKDRYSAEYWVDSNR